MRADQTVPAILGNLRSSLLLVWSGGTFLHDFTGSLRWFRTLVLTLGLVGAARRLGNQVWLLGVGIGPVSTWWGRTLISWILRQADVVVTRDESSKQLGATLVPDHPKLCASFDLAIVALVPESQCSRGVTKQTRTDVQSIGPVVGVSLLPVGKMYGLGVDDSALVDAVVQALLQTVGCRRGTKVKALAFNYRSDVPICETLATRLNANGIHAEAVTYRGDPYLLYREVCSCDFMISMRYHAVLYSFVAARPQLVLAYHPKCVQLADEIQLDRRLVLGANSWNMGDIARALRTLFDFGQTLPRGDPFSMRQRVVQTLRQLLVDAGSSKFAGPSANGQ